MASSDVESQNTGIRILGGSSSPGPQERMDNKGQILQHSPNTLSYLLGVDDLVSLDVWRASMAELLGAAVLEFMTDAFAISAFLSDIKVPNLLLSVFVGVIVVLLMLALAPISGGQINPTISFSAALLGIVSMSRALIYITAQCLGSVLGAAALNAVVSSNIAQQFALGGCTVSVTTPGADGQPVTIGLDTAQALWLEIICTFTLLSVTVWMAFDFRQLKQMGIVRVFTLIGVVIGLLVFVSTSVTGQKGYTGAGMNPARCLGPAVMRGGHLWDRHWVFWLGPFIACIAFYLYTKIIPGQHFTPKIYEHDLFNIVKALIGNN